MRPDAEDRHYRQQVLEEAMPELSADDRAYLDKVFTYHPPKDGQPYIYECLRTAHKEVAEEVLLRCPPSRERSVALTHLETAAFWANASIARFT